MTRNIFIFHLLTLTLAALVNGQPFSINGPTHNKVVVCFVEVPDLPNCNDGRVFTIDDLEPALCTHLVYYYAMLDDKKGLAINTVQKNPLDSSPYVDYGKVGYKRMVDLKNRYPHLKVIISVAADREYSRMIASAETRAKFIKLSLAFLNEYKFDGLNLYWYNPGMAARNDKENFGALVKELSEALKPKGYILTATLSVYHGLTTMDKAYDLPTLNRYLDLIYLDAAYYSSDWSKTVQAKSPLRGTDESDINNVEYSVKYILEHGVSAHKLALSMDFGNAQAFTLTDPSTRDVVFGQTASNPAPYHTRLYYCIGFKRVCRRQLWDEKAAMPYFRNNDIVVTYENPRSIANKVKTAIDYDLRGVVVRRIDSDDVQGNCNTKISDGLVDFRERYNKIIDDPVLNEALNTLNLPDSSYTDIQAAYTVSNGRLQLRIPELRYSNYPLMRTIHQSIFLAIEEKRIETAIKVVAKQKAIKQENKNNKPESAASINSTNKPISAASINGYNNPESAASINSTNKPISAASGNGYNNLESAASINSTNKPISAASDNGYNNLESAASINSTNKPISAASGNGYNNPESAASINSTNKPISAASDNGYNNPESAASINSTNKPISAASVNGYNNPESSASINSTNKPIWAAPVNGYNNPESAAAVNHKSFVFNIHNLHIHFDTNCGCDCRN